MPHFTKDTAHPKHDSNPEYQNSRNPKWFKIIYTSLTMNHSTQITTTYNDNSTKYHADNKITQKKRNKNMFSAIGMCISSEKLVVPRTESLYSPHTQNK